MRQMYGDNPYSAYMNKRREAANVLIENVRILSINEQNDALTLSVDLFSNVDYFLDIIKIIDTDFLAREYK